MLKKGLLIISSLALSLLICEIALRIIGFGGEREWTLEDAVPVVDEILDYRLKPYADTRSGGVSYRLNGQGFRDVARKYNEKGEGCRLVVTGDSVAFGYKVEFAKIFSRQIESLLNKEFSFKTAEVFNLALPGINTLQESQLLLGDGGKLDPDLVILLYVLNDADDGVSYGRATQKRAPANCSINLLNLPIPCVIKRWAKQSAVLFFLKDKLDSAVWKLGIGDNDDPNNSMQSDYFSKLYKNSSGWEKHVVDGFERIKTYGEKRGVPVVMVIFPVMFDFADYKWGWIHKKVAAEAERHGFRVIDLLGEYMKYPVTQTRLERGDFVHPNALGHRLAASAVVTYIHDHPDVLRRCDRRSEGSS